MNSIRRRITRNGGCYTVNLPKVVLTYLGWTPGEEITIRVTERQTVELARATLLDFAPPKIAAFLQPPQEAAK